jgi:hypothetical protein
LRLEIGISVLRRHCNITDLRLLAALRFSGNRGLGGLLHRAGFDAYIHASGISFRGLVLIARVHARPDSSQKLVTTTGDLGIDSVFYALFLPSRLPIRSLAQTALRVSKHGEKGHRLARDQLGHQGVDIKTRAVDV